MYVEEAVKNQLRASTFTFGIKYIFIKLHFVNDFKFCQFYLLVIYFSQI